MAVWFVVSYVCGILLCDSMDATLPAVGNAPFGFWMAQQGSILIFVVILVVYAFLMNRLDAKHGYKDEN